MQFVETPQSQCQLGVARCDITPPVGIYHRMWGAATHDRATGVHRPLTGTVLVFRSASGTAGPETEQVLVALDLCILWYKETTALIEAICRTNELAAEQVIVTFSHTHAGGLMGLERAHLPGGDLIPPYLDRLTTQVCDLVGEARRSAQPATLTYASGECALTANRDFWDEESRQFVCGFNPAGPADRTVLVVRATDAAGKTIANVVNYACHPTTLAWQNTLISTDFPGAMRELVETATGVPCIFIQGASGDLGPVEGFLGDAAVADRNGRQLGYAALSVMEGLPAPGTRFEYQGPVVSGATLGAWAHRPLDAEALAQNSRWRLRRWTVDLAYRPEVPTLEKVRSDRAQFEADEKAALQSGDLAKARDSRAMVERMTRWFTRLEVMPAGATFPFPVSLWQMGDAFWLAVEAEHYQLLQAALRRRFAKNPIVVATLANGARCTYLPTQEAYGKGIYQESIAVLAPGCLEQLIAAIGQQIETWLEEG